MKKASAQRTAQKSVNTDLHAVVFTPDNTENMRNVIRRYKNILVCGIRGAGKIRYAVKALKDSPDVYYIGNPVDHEGRSRPGSYQKYVRHIMDIKKDLRIADDISSLLNMKNNCTVIIDEIYERTDQQIKQISSLFDKENIRCIQIVGCMKYMKDLIYKIDFIMVLEPDGAFTVDKAFAQTVCKVLNK